MISAGTEGHATAEPVWLALEAAQGPGARELLSWSGGDVGVPETGTTLPEFCLPQPAAQKLFAGCVLCSTNQRGHAWGGEEQGWTVGIWN